MRTFAQKPIATQQARSTKSRVPRRAHFGQSREVEHLQRTIGNQAVQSLLQTDAQAPITMRPLGDVYEREADHLSEQVMRRPEPQLQRFWRGVSAEQRGQESQLPKNNRTGSSGSRQTAAPAFVQEVLSSPGRPLESTARAFMETRFGHDFRGIRIHDDQHAAESAERLGALAYTAGKHIVFGSGQYAPNTADGKRLLAHELTHSIQQQDGQVRLQRRVKIGKPTVSTDSEQARAKAREIADSIKGGKADDQRLAHWLEFFEGSAWHAFLDELESSIAERITEFESEPEEHKDIFASSTETSLIIPTSEAKVARGGFKVAYFAQVLEETSESTSVEVYNDLSASAGLSVEIPLGKVAKFKFGAEAKRGRRSARKEEQKEAKRSGTTISRSFTIQKMEREVMNFQYLKTYIAPAPIAKEVRRTPTGHGIYIQNGFRIVPDEGGEPWGPFWNIYSGYVQVQGSALTPVWEVLAAEQRKIAEDLVFGRP